MDAICYFPNETPDITRAILSWLSNDSVLLCMSLCKALYNICHEEFWIQRLRSRNLFILWNNHNKYQWSAKRFCCQIQSSIIYVIQHGISYLMYSDPIMLCDHAQRTLALESDGVSVLIAWYDEPHRVASSDILFSTSLISKSGSEALQALSNLPRLSASEFMIVGTVPEVNREKYYEVYKSYTPANLQWFEDNNASSVKVYLMNSNRYYHASLDKCYYGYHCRYNDSYRTKLVLLANSSRILSGTTSKYCYGSILLNCAVSYLDTVVEEVPYISLYLRNNWKPRDISGIKEIFNHPAYHF